MMINIYMKKSHEINRKIDDQFSTIPNTNMKGWSLI